METKEKEKPKEITKTEKTIVDNVLARINTFQSSGELQIPKDYSPENALKSAYLILAETVDKNDKPVLQSCSMESIANSLLDMVVQGLSPLKKQCAFIAYNGKMSLVREYHGNIMLAKRFGNVKTVLANVIYVDDVFEYEINNGVKKVIKHEQKFENIDEAKIRGVYATLVLNDNSVYVEIMNMAQVFTAWNQGHAKGQSPAHKNFKSEMAKKTVINRACKLFISTSDDNGVFDETEKEANIINKENDITSCKPNAEILDIKHIDIESKVKKPTILTTAQQEGSDEKVIRVEDVEISQQPQSKGKQIKTDF